MKPFLKWAGGKYRVLPNIYPELSDGCRYIEPFAGSCAVALNTNYNAYILCDTNADLINLYNIVITRTDDFIKEIETLFIAENNTPEKFYKLRNEFNTTEDIFTKSVLFVYLNRHAFNGLCRYNKSGGFNVPFGKYKKPYIPKAEIIHFADKFKNASFKIQDFRTTMIQVGKGDIVYCDPPYVPLSDTASFTAYAKNGFTEQDQQDLAEHAIQAQFRGAKIYISNHDTLFTRTLYENARIESFTVNRVISANASSRGQAGELLAIYPYYKHHGIRLYLGDCMQVLENLPADSVHMIFADPPYMLSNGGFSNRGGKRVSVNKGDWDKSQGIINDFNFHEKWILACRRVLKPHGTIWISGTYHSIYACGFALQKNDFHILNDISWFKPNASPNLSKRFFTASHENLIWARKYKNEKHTFHYNKMRDGDFTGDILKNPNKQMRSVWAIPHTPPSEKTNGKHPTQKPLRLLHRIITACTNEKDIILDPFCGSGTTGVIAKQLNRNFVGIDICPEYLDISKRRIDNI